MTGWYRVRLLLGAVLVALAMVTVACSSESRISATASFADISDLQKGAPIRMSNLQVGTVSGIAIGDDGQQVTVTLGVDAVANVPADVQANVRLSTPIGEYIVELVPGTNDPNAAPLTDGMHIGDTQTIPDLESLLASGQNLFGALSASQISTLLEEGATALGGRGPLLNELLANFDTVVAGYNSRSATVDQLVGDVDRLAADLAPGSAQTAEVLGHLRETTEILAVNAEQLTATVRSVANLSNEGADVIRDHFDDIALQFDALRSVTNALAVEEAALARVLVNIPEARQTLGRVVALRDPNYGNVITDVIVCGLPEAIGGEVPGDPLNGCDGPGGPP